MWFHGVVFLAATALFSSVNCKATGLTKVNTPKTPVIAPLLSAEAPTQRMLRIDVNSEDGDEARVFDFSEYLEGWLREKKSPDYVLRQMNARVHGTLENGVVGDLFKYVAKHNEKYSGGRSTVRTLTRNYRRDGHATVAAMIQRGIRSSNPETKELAEKLEAEQFRNWGNESPVGIFKKLNLEREGDEAFLVMQGDAYQAFKRYLDFYNHHNPKVTVFEVFKDIYGDHKLALMIENAMGTSPAAQDAQDMKRAQFDYWYTNGNGNPSDYIRRHVFNYDDLTPADERILDRYKIYLFG